LANSDSNMQRFESRRPSQRVRSLRVKSDGATLDWRPDIGGNAPLDALRWGLIPYWCKTGQSVTHTELGRCR
jgi:hypothetical protein